MSEQQSTVSLEARLWKAAALGDCKTIRMLAMGGAGIDARNEDGFTAFNIATQNGHSDAAMAILAAREMRYAKELGVDPAEFYKVPVSSGQKKRA